MSNVPLSPGDLVVYRTYKRGDLPAVFLALVGGKGACAYRRPGTNGEPEMPGGSVSTFSDMTVEDPMWLPAAEKAAEQGNAKGLYKLPGYEKCGYTVNYFARVDGSFRWTLNYRFGRGKNTKVASWITDWLPLDRARRPERPINLPKGPIRITSNDSNFYAVVELDQKGLPCPIPEVVLAARSAMKA